MKVRDWEQECLPSLLLPDDNGNIALCVLWHQIESVVEQIPDLIKVSRLGVIGNLRTPIGISWFLRGLGRLNNITTVVVWGNDLLKTGVALSALWNRGLTPKHEIPGLSFAVDRKIPKPVVNRFRKEISLIDAGKVSLEDLPAFLEDLPQKGSLRSKVILPPPDPITTLSLPDPHGIITVRAGSQGMAWMKILDLMLSLGKKRMTRKQEELRWRNDVAATFPVPKNEIIEPCFRMIGIGPREVEEYWKSFYSPKKATGVDYGYGERMLNWRGHNQLEELVFRLQKSPDTKRASIVFLEPVDIKALKDAPCLVIATFNIHQKELNLSVVFRSHAMLGGWPLNVFALLRLQRLVAKKLGIGLGTFSVLSQNAQLYSTDLQRASRIVEQYLPTVTDFGAGFRFESDPAGNFIFSVEGGKVWVRVTNKTGDKVFLEMVEENPQALIRWLVSRMGSWLDPQHVLYLGQELQKLKQSIQTGKPYSQG